ncbi:zf-TFIIB domain-containing protein [Cellulomonas sp. DKR-3]|uniref:Zf-TFIIB domain-containing protein n=1 Tax=Cellulomonas fulva TaxID=2835530 RepID=A0ABS5TW99_9CELL|nr:zf-TFIIB domain-containing protein [Cellulomonas fulva]MBT0993415.1 zf-TFIIB domain-containing protein [Cellulomonas fulva]
MKCPVDQVDLVMSERQGVEIDYCPTCRGIWLDRGELDKILDRAAAMAPATEPGVPGAPAVPAVPAAPAPAPAPAYGTPPADVRPDTRTAYPDPRYADPRPGYDRYDERSSDRRYDERSRDSSYDPRQADPRYGDPRYGDPRYRRKKKRESWLGDLLDFD